jgi:glycosyltransferase involved in cell wall biosynthesis
VGVVIIARDEERHIAKTLESVTSQTLQPRQIIVVNDGSTDRTREIAEGFDGVIILDFPIEHESWVIRKELARVVNYGLIELDDSLDYAVLLGSDEVLPPNHFEYLTGRMQRDNLMMASGKIRGEYSTIPRGSGRIVDWKWWLEISGGLYPVNYGFESWMIAKCKAMHLKFDIFPEIESHVQRKTGTNYETKLYRHRGQAYRALGYNRRFVMIRSLLMLVKYHNPKAGINMLRGFLDSSVENYERDIREYYRELQDRQTSIFNVRDLINRYREL